MNPYEQLHRSRKVILMADYLWAHMSRLERLDVDFPVRIRRVGNDWRDTLAHAAECRTPSDATWAALCYRIAEMIDAERERLVPDAFERMQA